MTGRAAAAERRARVAAHDRGTLAVVAVAALVVGSYAAWMAGDYVDRTVGVVVFGAVAGTLLVQQPTARAVVARALALLAGLVLVTPVFLSLPLVTAALDGVDPVAALVHPGVAVLALAFGVVAAVLAGVAVGVDR